MLRLVIDPTDDQLTQTSLAFATVQQCEHLRINGGTINEHLSQSKSSSQSSLWPRIFLTNRLIVGVEYFSKAGGKGRVIEFPAVQNKGFKKKDQWFS